MQEVSFGRGEGDLKGELTRERKRSEARRRNEEEVALRVDVKRLEERDEEKKEI